MGVICRAASTTWAPAAVRGPGDRLAEPLRRARDRHHLPAQLVHRVSS